MHFPHHLSIDRPAVLRALRYPSSSAAPPELDEAIGRIESAAAPRWIYRQYIIAEQADRKNGIALSGAALVLPGQSIAAHLDGCGACILLALTLGAEIDAAIRAAQAADAALGVWADACASILAEQHAELAEQILREQAKPMRLTGRFSPGYGDLPLSLQPVFLRRLDTPRAIGLTVSPTHIMLPRKSITAIVGVKL